MTSTPRVDALADLITGEVGMAARVLAQDVGRALTQAREAKGRSRADMARELGVSDVTLLELELGRGNPTLGRIAKYAHAYGVDLDVVTRTRRPRRKARQ